MAFLATYFLDLTGLEWHQSIGIAAAIFLIIHILTHAAWIRSVSERFFAKLNGRLRLYYFLDAFLFLVIIVITITGILISTWLEIGLDIYPRVREVHVLSSISGLGVLILKLALHWKWFYSLFPSIRLRRAVRKTSPSLTPQPAKTYSRRDALKVIGGLAAIGGLGIFKAVDAMVIPEQVSQAALLSDPKVHTQIAKEPEIADSILSEDPTLDHLPAGGGHQRRRGKSSGENVALAEDQQMPQEDLRAVPTPETQPESNPVLSTDYITRCPKACAFPGLCRRYVDENGNQLCDLGECWPV